MCVITDLKRTVLKEEIIAITDDILEALILSHLIECSEIPMYSRQEKWGENGWFTQKPNDIIEVLKLKESKDSVYRRLNSLIKKRYIFRRKNPDFKDNRAYQYLYKINYNEIINSMYILGYTYQGKQFNLREVGTIKVQERNGENNTYHAIVKTQFANNEPQFENVKSQIANAHMSEVLVFAEACYEKIMLVLEKHMSKTVLNDCFENAEPIDIEQNSLVVYIPTLQEKFTLDQKFHDVIHTLLEGHTEIPVCDVKFVTVRK